MNSSAENILAEHMAKRIQRIRQRQQDNSSVKAELPVLIHDVPNRFEPFPLADLQQAYWLGRSAFIDGGNVGIHGYFEVEREHLDIKRFIAAWCALIERHDMLRVYVTENGEQQVLSTIPHFDAPVVDLRHLSEDEQTQKILELREEMAHRVFDLGVWPQFDLRFVRITDATTHIHMCIDGWCMDGWSYQIMFRELGLLYEQPDLILPKPPFLFRDYVLALKNFESTPRYERDLSYWKEHIINLPPPPLLPLMVKENKKEAAMPPTFTRYEGSLGVEEWLRFRNFARENQLTIANCLLAIFSEILAFWSQSPQLTLNVPNFNRLPVHPGIAEVVGQFASFTLHRADCSKKMSFLQRALQTQQSMWTDLQYNTVSGMRVLREAAKQANSTGTQLFPVVFTTAPGQIVDGQRVTAALSLSSIGKTLFYRTHTPQVWLDCQYVEYEDQIEYFWDVVDGMYPASMIEEMFACYSNTLKQLANDEQAWYKDNLIQLPPKQAQRRKEVNATAHQQPQGSYLDYLTQQVQTYPQNIAVISEGVSYTYQDLDQQIRTLAFALQQAGVNAKDRVAILQPKGWHQIVSVWAILAVGATYVPLDHKSPEQRIKHMITDAQVALTLTLSHDIQAPTGASVNVDQINEQTKQLKAFALRQAEDLTYIIYTSGSTGEPKGVMVKDQGVLNAIHATQRRLTITPQDKIFGISALHHDMSVYDTLGGICAGATLIIPSAHKDRDATHWLDQVQQHQVTFWSSVPAMMEMLLTVAQAQTEKDAIGKHLKWALLGGDWLPVTLPERLKTQAPNCQLVSVGGPTETTMWNIMHVVKEKDSQAPSIPYGQPIDNTQYYIMDELGRERPDYAIGQMYCAGAGVSAGYWNKEEQTVQKYTQHPQTGQRIYATGDLGSWLPTGEIRFIGRADGQVKINGMRIETAEIESVLQRHPKVKEAAVVVGDHPQGHSPLYAFVVLKDCNQVELNEEKLLAWLSSSLPMHMIPARVLLKPSLPVTENIKINRRALVQEVEEFFTLVQESNFDEDPLTGLELEVAQLWGEILGTSPFSRKAHFFKMGGDSLQATRMAIALRKKFSVSLAPDIVFQYPFLSQQVEMLNITQAEGKENQIPRTSVDDVGPMSLAQRRLWLLDQMNPGQTTYNLPFIIHLKGSLKAEVFRDAFCLVCERHVALRSHFKVSDDQVFMQPLDAWENPLLMESKIINDESELMRIAEQEALWCFDLQCGPLVRARLIQTGADEWRFFLTLHHIIFDAWSTSILFKDLAFAYTQLCSNHFVEWKPLPINYVDYAAWQFSEYGSKDIGKSLAYWKEKLDGIETLNLPIDKPRPQRESHAGDIAHIHIDAETGIQIEKLAKTLGVTNQQVLLCAFALTLSVYSCQEDIAIGVPVANRLNADVEEIIGFFVNSLIIRLQIDPSISVIDLIHHVQQTMQAAQQHQSVPFAQVVEAVAPARDMSRNPLYQVGFDVHAQHLHIFEMPDIAVSFSEPPITTTHTDLELTLLIHDNGYYGYMTYATDLFEKETVECLLLHFLMTLKEITSNPSQDCRSLCVAAPEEEKRLIKKGQGEELHLPFNHLAKALRYRKSASPDAVALMMDGLAPLSFDGLWTLSNRIANGLCQQGVCAGDRIAVMLPRSYEWVATVLSAHRLGASVAIIDPHLPQEHQKVLLEVSQPKQRVTHDAQTGIDINMLTAFDGADFNEMTHPKDEAFVLFTSGSTGRPKGVMLSHQNILNRLAWGEKVWPWSMNDVVCQKTALSFVDVIAETFSPLLAGVPLMIVPNEQARVPSSLLLVLSQTQSTRLTITPTVLRALLDEGMSEQILPSLKLIICSGERLPLSLLQKVRAVLPQVKIWNVYGSTEVSADVCACDVTLWTVEPVPIGQPIAATSVVLKDSWGRIVPYGAPGQVVVEGRAVSLGYLGEPQKSFVYNERGEIVAFHTGDLARWGKHGQLEYLGRADQQIKIRGVRIEPEAIESVLMKLPYVKACAVHALPERTGISQYRLCVYVVTNSQVGIASLRQEMRGHLPEPMIPSQWALVDVIPRTPNGKINWQIFDEYVQQNVSQNDPPSGELELCLANLWENVCEIKAFSRNDDFFTVGGHSLSAARLSSYIEKEWAISFSLSDVFANPVFSMMASAIAARVVLVSTNDELALEYEEGEL